MKFDQLYKLMINEANQLEDDADLNDFENEIVAMDNEDLDPSTMSDSQKLDYLMKNAEYWNKDGLPPNKLQVHATYFAQNGEMFKMLFDKIESKKDTTPMDDFGGDELAPTNDEELPPEAATPDIDSELEAIDPDAGVDPKYMAEE